MDYSAGADDPRLLKHLVTLGFKQPIMVAQTMRVVLTVMAAPFMVIHFANDGQFHQIQQAGVMAWPGLAVLALCSGVGGFLVSRTAYPNGWFMGPLLTGALKSLTPTFQTAPQSIASEKNQPLLPSRPHPANGETTGAPAKNRRRSKARPGQREAP